MPQLKKNHPPATPQLTIVYETKNDECILRTDKDRRQQIELMLSGLPMSPAEIQFVVDTAEHVVDLVCDQYVLAAKKHAGLNPECISAATTLARMIVDDDRESGEVGRLGLNFCLIRQNKIEI